jgi:pimeloyl-ACP methyl ester carboxylesterase
MHQTSSKMLRMSGASLSYQVCGSGPLLLLIAGGGGGSANFQGLVHLLADSYTLVTYHRRGAIGSPLDDPEEDVSLETQSEDAHLLLAELTHEPAVVFGSSAGALIGLDLVARYPQQVRLLVAHEPPTEYLLPDGAQAFPEDALDLYHREGGMVALQRFIAYNGMNSADREPDVELAAAQAESAANADAFFRYNLLSVRRYRLDFAKLLATPTQIVLAGGETGRAYVGYRGATAVAERLGTSVVEFPGHHVGYLTHPRAFAERLRGVLKENDVALRPENRGETKPPC